MKQFALSFLLVFLFSGALSVKGQTADFTASVTTGCSPLVVAFTNTTGCSSCTYTWDLDNGSGPIHLTDCSGSYITPGTYTVTLTSTTSAGVTTTHTETITVYPSPTVHFTASDTAICPGSTITFTSTSTGGVSGPLTYIWNFGDGTSSTSATPAKTYSTSGYYNVTLSVTNSNGCTSSLTLSEYIHVFTPAMPSFSASTNYFCTAPGHASFFTTTSGFGPFTYTWRFGDGGTGTGSTPTHTYSSPGSYNVTLIVTDGHGCTDSTIIPGYIFVGDLTAGFSSPATACVNTYVSFPNTSSPHISSSWSYGGSSYGTTDAGSNMYHTPGTYTVTLIVFDGYCYDTVSHTITILPGPTTSFVTTPHPCPQPTPITFTGTAPPGTSVTWLYGDGSTGTGLTSTHTYAGNGIDSIRMISVNPATGCIDTVVKVDTFYNLHVILTVSTHGGCAPVTVLFGANVYTTIPDSSASLHPYPYGVASWSWTFGDGGTSTDSTPTHTYIAAGDYVAQVIITTTNGCTVTDTIHILVGTPPVATFSITPAHTCYHDNEITFTPTIITGPVTLFIWEFGDGSVEDDPPGPVVHHYELPGIFSETLIPVYNDCYGPPFVLTNNLILDSPKAIALDTVLCSPVNNVEFFDASLGDNTHLWVFGDGTTSTLSNPVHAYPAPVTYGGYLATYNIASGCRDTSGFGVDLSRPTVNFSADTTICRDGYAIFTPVVSSGLVTGYTWYRNWFLRDDTSAVYLDTFHVTGRYTISMVYTDQNGCADTLTKNNYELVAKPVASFTITPATGCWPMTATFTDHTTDVTGTFFTHYAWAFGDGATTTVTTPSTVHTFTIVGNDTATEVVTDNIGCKDTVEQYLTIYRPAATFTCGNTHPCENDSTLFNNTSTGIVSSYWFFGDGGTSTLNSPWHTYAAPGLYTVKLVVTDAHGCTDTAVIVNYISVTQPTASFYMNDSLSICPPLTVNFINTSTGATSYSWTFGDGSSSLAFSPTDLYITNGLYTVTLIATNSYGCSASAIGHVTIFGYAGAFSYTPDSGCVPLTVHFYAMTSNVPSITWDFADGNTSTASFSDSISHTYLVPGAYVPKLILSDNTGCKSSSLGADTIKVDGVTPGFTTIPDPVCIGSAFYLSDTSKSFWSTITTWNWTFQGTTSNIDSPSFVIDSVGVYPASLTVTDGWGCTASVNENVNVYPLPVITVSPDTIICVHDAATLTGYGGVSYTWSPIATVSCTKCNPTLASPTVITQYTVTGTDKHGCSSTDTTSVFLKTNTVSVARGDTQICDGLTVPLFDSGGTKYTWIPGTGLSNPDIADPLATPNYNTTYMAIAQLAGCIPDTNYVTVIVHPLPTVDAGPDQKLLEGSVAHLSATGTLIYTYAWDNGNTLSCDTCADPVAVMSVTTTYTIQVSSIFGCTSSDSVTIHLYCDNNQIFVPNAFTPNGDGQDDVFYPRGKGVSIIKSFRIYNRWGQMLFERTDIQLNDASNAWDGSYNGGGPRADVYVYIIDAICDTGEPLNLKGDVTIIR